MFNIIKINGREIEYKRLNNCINGNPRYLFHYLEFDWDYNKALKMVRKIGGKKYRSKNYKGFVISSYNLESDLNYIFK